jgi:hypothetical protein
VVRVHHLVADLVQAGSSPLDHTVSRKEPTR